MLPLAIADHRLDAQPIEDVCVRETVSADFELGGSLSYYFSGDGRIDFELNIYQPPIGITGVWLLYGVDRTVHRAPTDEELRSLGFMLRTKIELRTGRDEYRAEFQMNESFPGFALIIELQEQVRGPVASCGGASLVISVASEDVAADIDGDDFIQF